MAAQNRLRDLVSEAMGPTRVDEVAEAISDGADVNWKYPNERAVLDYCVSLEPVYNTASESEYTPRYSVYYLSSHTPTHIHNRGPKTTSDSWRAF